jgi:hypothetical protein
MSKRYQLCYTEAITNTVRVLRHVKLDEAMVLVEQGKAEPVHHHDTGLIIGFELIGLDSRPTPKADPRLARVKEVLEERRAISCAAFSRAEVEAIVGLRGKSATAHLSEDEKAERIRRRWCGEDLVEAARNKYAVYQSVY